MKKDKFTVPTVNEQQDSSLGEIKINHSVVASIVRLAATEIDGVYSVESSLVEGIAEIFSKKDSDRGVRVSENEVGDYVIEIRVILRFGVSLADIAVKIQENVKEKVEKMTMKTVSRIDVIIDGVRHNEISAKKSSQFCEHPIE